mgnify:CR=1 FL=1
MGFSGSAKAAPCCARNAATPMLIVGDDRAQFNVGLALANVVAVADEEGIPTFGAPQNSEALQTYRLDGSFLLSDRLQAGASFSLVNHSITADDIKDSTFAMGDTRLHLGYEIMPVWNYSKWKPQGFLFTTLTLPTGRSIHESQKGPSTDVTGNGFYAVSVGMLAVKRVGFLDFFVVPEVHYSFPRVFSGDLDRRLLPGWGGSIGAGFGWSPGGGNLRLGLRVHPRLDQGVTSIYPDRVEQSRGWLSVCDTGFDAAYLLSATDSLMVSYTDQTLLGVATNLNLNRSLSINFQHRLER